VLLSALLLLGGAPSAQDRSWTVLAYFMAIVPTREGATGHGKSVTDATTEAGFDPTKGPSCDYKAIDAGNTGIYLELEACNFGNNYDYIAHEGPAAEK
jgi:hypothetical protein